MNVKELFEKNKPQLRDAIVSGEIDPDDLFLFAKPLADVDPHSLQIKLMSTGFPSLDEVLFLKESHPEIVVIGGRPSSGKSAFMFQLAHNISAQGKPVHVFSLEMDSKQVMTRMLAAEINKSITAIQLGYIDDDLLIEGYNKVV